MDNPLLTMEHLPEFSRIKPEHVVPAIDTILAENRAALQELLQKQNGFTWENLIAPLEEMEDHLNKCWSPVRHLHSVADNAALRKAYNDCLSKLSDYETDILHNHDLYLAYKQIADSDQYQNLDSAQKKIIDDALRDFHLAGVTLEADRKQTYKKIEQTLSSVQSKFEENVLDATHAWSKLVTERKVLTGLPESAIDLAAQSAKEKGAKGWLFTLDFPSYYPVMQYAQDRSLREEMYEAYVTRASEQGPGTHAWDNSKLMEQILALRTQKAELLDFESYADYSLERKMADSPQTVLEFLHNLVKHSHSTARDEFRELSEYARNHHNMNDLNAWDIAFYSEKLRQHKFDFSQEQLKPYFPVTSILSGLFGLVNRLYGFEISEVEKPDVWHQDVRFYDIRTQDGSHRGSFYLDLFARKNKRGGAWMDECIVRKRNGTTIQQPVAYLNCNFTPPVNNHPSLLTHDEVTTLFHEFGHGLHHMLTLIDYPSVSGINGVPWDAVELPSQIMENWCWERKLLDIMARHHETGEPLPEDLYRKLMQAKNFQSGMQMVRQLEFALFDFRLHYERNKYDSQAIQILLDSVREETAVNIPPAYNRFQHGFSHIFAGGYAAGYYSYKWAEVLSADAFSKFEEKGIFDRNTGEQFLHSFLEQGGSRDPMDLFMEFRGRKPSITPLLKHSGIEIRI